MITVFPNTFYNEVQKYSQFFDFFSNVFRKVFRRFRHRGIFFDSTIIFHNLAHTGAIWIGPKIVEIGAILAIFRPFKIFDAVR